MKFKKLIPICFLALGLTLTVPLAAHAAESGNVEETEKQTQGWASDNSYFLVDGKKVTGVRQIDGTYYYFGENGILATGSNQPIKYGKDLYFVLKNGTLLRNKWAIYDGKYYYGSGNAKLYTYTAEMIGGKIYCFNQKGEKLTSGFKKINGKSYLVNAKGVAYTGYKKYNGKQYFFDTMGVMKKNTTVKYGNNIYFTGSNGRVRSGWFKSKGKTYYADSKGRLKTGWQTRKGKRYYFNARTGAMKTGWTRYEGKYYYYTSSGSIKTGWFKVKGKKYYGMRSGSTKGARQTGFQLIGGTRYLFDGKGVLCTGWKKRGSYKYYMSSKGVVTTGWRRIGSKWYFFESSGIMKTGWLVHNGQFYYMHPKTGAMVTGRKRIDGKLYSFSSNGVYKNGSLSGSWTIKVNRGANVVTVYKGNTPVKAFLCSTGLNNATPLGTFRVLDKLYLHELNGPTWGYYCSHITSDILFHSIPAPTTARKKVPSYKFNLLGQQASQGCIRLAMGDAKWLYDTVPTGSTVVVYHDSRNPGPLGKPKRISMSTNPTYSIDPTDPVEYPSYSTSR